MASAANATAAGWLVADSKLRPSDPTPHLAYLDSLRGVAILGVLSVHVAAVTLQTSKLSWWLYSAASGVELFYAVSAFTLFFSLDTRSRERHPTSNFFLRRFFRIAPLFYVTIALTWVRLRLPFVHGYRPTHLEYVLGFVFLFGFKPVLGSTIVAGGWSIAVESTFYAILPIIHRLVRSFRTAALTFSASYLAILPLSFWLAHRYPENFGYFGIAWFPAQLPMFLMGVLLYLYAKEFLTGVSKAKSKTASAVLLAVCTILFLWKHLHVPDFWESDYALDIFLIGGFFLAIVLHPWKLFVNAFTRFMGKLSFSLYLLHFFVIETLPKFWAILSRQPDAFLGTHYGHLPCFFVFYLVALAASTGVAMLSWKWIEQPGIRLGRKIIAYREQRTAARVTKLPNLRERADTSDAQF